MIGYLISKQVAANEKFKLPSIQTEYLGYAFAVPSVGMLMVASQLALPMKSVPRLIAYTGQHEEVNTLMCTSFTLPRIHFCKRIFGTMHCVPGTQNAWHADECGSCCKSHVE